MRNRKNYYNWGTKNVSRKKTHFKDNKDKVLTKQFSNKWYFLERNKCKKNKTEILERRSTNKEREELLAEPSTYIKYFGNAEKM